MDNQVTDIQHFTVLKKKSLNATFSTTNSTWRFWDQTHTSLIRGWGT